MQNDPHNLAKSIIIVEDDAGVRGGAERLLRQHGYQVSAVGSLADARSILDRNGVPEDPRLLVDVVLGDENGMAFAVEVVTEHPAARVLLMSAYSDDVLFGASHLAPQISFLKKPFTATELIEAVSALFVVPV